MHIHIIGICGTFMGGAAALAKSAGHTVSGCDLNVYPPMSTQLRSLGIEIDEGYDPQQLKRKPDCVVVGNVMSRGNPLIEALLDSDIPYTSGPEWLAAHVLKGRRVIACAGTHGKTTTASMLAWLLETSGRKPGFLIGGVPQNFGVSARLGDGDFFVVEADEYDTAFFDKRAKFVHYRPEIAILNNLEFDHADIYPDLAAIERQFHHLIRSVPARGKLLVNAESAALDRVLDMGAWSPVSRFGIDPALASVAINYASEPDHAELFVDGKTVAKFYWPFLGRHNLENAAAAVSAGIAVGLDPLELARALETFQGAKRRLELLGNVAGIEVYDDFAHHPTAIEQTITGIRRAAPNRRIVVALEPRSNTMRLGVHESTIAAALAGADQVLLYVPENLPFDLKYAVRSLGDRCRLLGDYTDVLAALAEVTQPGDIVVLMSNGGFGEVREKALDTLAAAHKVEATG